MSRNGSGTYTLPEAPFVPLTTISSAAMNSDLSDIASALTGSLARDGQGGMTDVLPLNTTGFNYTNDTNTGMYRSGSDTQAIKCGGTNTVSVTSSGATVTGTLAVTGIITQAGFRIIPVGLGPLPWSGASAPSGWVLCYGQSLSRTTYSELWTFAQAEIAGGSLLYGPGDGTTSFTVPDLRGKVPAGKDNMGGVAAGLLTSTTITPNGNTLGAGGGAQTATIAQTNLPNVSLSVSGTFSGNSTRSDVLTSSGISSQSGGATGVSGLNTIIGVSGSITGSTSALGSGTALDKIQPTIITNYIIFAGV